MWLPSWLRTRKRHATPRPRPTFRPRLEALEGRVVPSFGNPITTSVYQPVAMATADLNGDGKADLVVATPTGVEVLLGKGNGHFANPINLGGVGTSYTPAVMAVADVNGDGKLDIVTGNNPGDGSAYGMSASISVFLGNGNGGFQSAQNYEVYQGASVTIPKSIAVSDLNGDGLADVVLTGYGSGSGVEVWMNSADPNHRFASVQSYNAVGYNSTGASSMAAVGDFNGDGKPDIVMTWGTQVEVLLNTGAGAFGTPQPYDVGGSPASVAVGDVNGDGRLDIVTANYEHSVSVLRGNGDGTFGAAQTYAIGGAPNSIALGDFNKDGKLDIVTTGSEMDVLLNNGDGAFGAAQKVGPAGSSVAVGDFNGDGFPDLAQIDGSGASIDVLLNNAVWTTGGLKGHK